MAAPQSKSSSTTPSISGSAGSWKRVTPPLATILMVSLSMCLLYFARSVLIPTSLAILLTFLLGPLVIALQKWGVPRVPAVFVIVSTALLLLGLLSWLFVNQTLQLLNELPEYQAKVTARIEQMRSGGEPSLLSKVQSFGDRVVEALTKPLNNPNRGSSEDKVDRPQPVAVVDSNNTWIAQILAAITPILEPLAAAGLVVILLIYTLIEREGLRDRLLRLVGRGHIPLTTAAMDDAGRRISRYLLVQFLINVSFGVVIGCGLWLLGVPHALLWGIFATFLRYIPIVGPWLAAILPLTLSLLTSDGWLEPVLLIALFLTFEFIANLLVEPWLYGKTMGVSQSSLLIAIAFWTWLWGPMGLVMAAPLTVCLVIMGRYVPALKFFDILLGNEPPLTVDLRFYQRLLAHDQDDASQVVHEELRTSSLREIYDHVVIPALTYSRQDLQNGRLPVHDAEVIWRIIDEIAEEVALASSQVAIEPDSNAASSKKRVCILACAARDVPDEVALRMFERVVSPTICNIETASTDRLTSEIISQVEQDHPAVVCIASLPPGGIAHTRLICKKLRRHFPDLKILVGRWGLQSDVQTDRQDLTTAGADLVSVSLEETTAQLAKLIQLSRPAALADADSGPTDSKPMTNEEKFVV